MLSKIPSWVITVAGATIIIISTATSSTILHNVRADVGDGLVEIADSNAQFDRMWNSHLMSDRRSSVADSLFGQALNSNSDEVQTFLFEQTGYHLRGSLLAMMVAADVEITDNIPKEIANIEGDLARGEHNAFMKFKELIDQHRLKSQKVLNNKRLNIRKLQKNMELLQGQESIIHLAIVFFNILGLIIVLCKDLPVWKDRNSKSKRDHLPVYELDN